MHSLWQAELQPTALEEKLFLTLYTLTLEYIFSLLFSLHCFHTEEENLFNNQELHKLAIVSFNLMTVMLDSGVILQEEISW